jgi:hypothetical protein
MVFIIPMDPTTIAIISIVVASASEVIAYIPSLKANSVLQLIIEILRKVFPR